MQAAEPAATAQPAASRDKLEHLCHSVGEEIRRQRFARAKLLLETTKIPVADIAAETGFCTPSHLSNTFRDATGASPRAWRSRIRT